MVNLMNTELTPTLFTLSTEEVLAMVVEQNLLSIVLPGGINTIHLKHIVRIHGIMVNEKKESYSIFIHMIDGTFIQVDDMKAFSDKDEYTKCYSYLTTRLASYNTNNRN